MASDSDIAGDLPEDRPQPLPATGRKRKKAPPELSGDLRVFLVLASADGFWQDDFMMKSAADALPAGHRSMVVGLALAEWEWVPTAAAGDHPVFAARLQQRSQARHIHGYLAYKVRAAACLEEAVAPRATDPRSNFASLANRVLHAQGDSCNNESPLLFKDLLETWKKRGALPMKLVRLAPGLAWQVVRGEAACMHMVAVTARLQRKALLVHNEPSRRRLKALVECAGGKDDGGVLVAQPTPMTLARRRHEQRFDPEFVVEWLEATAFVKEVRKVHAAAAVFTKLIARRLGKKASDLKPDSAGYETLRRARVRADCVAMLLHRRFIHSLGDDCQIFIYCDASPQLRGTELFATSFDIYDGTGFHRRLAPVVSLERTQYDSTGKLLALLWQIWLMAGPKLDDLVRFCNRVRGLVTDQGTERRLASMPDAVGAFWKMIDPPDL